MSTGHENWRNHIKCTHIAEHMVVSTLLAATPKDINALALTIDPLVQGLVSGFKIN